MASRKPVPEPLTLASHQGEEDIHTPPLSAKSPKSPRSPFRSLTPKKQGDSDSQYIQEVEPPQRAPSVQTVPHYIPQQLPLPPGQERQERPARTGFFSSYKASKSSNRLAASDNSRLHSEGVMSRDTDRPSMAGKVSSQDTKKGKDTGGERSLSRKQLAVASKSEASLASTTDNTGGSGGNSGTGKKSKTKPFNLLGRSRSVRSDTEEQSPREDSSNNKSSESERERSATQTSLRTAPATSGNDKSFREKMGSNVRQRSEDRVPTAAKEGRDPKDTLRSQPTFSSNFPSGGHTFLTNAKSFASKGAGAISKGLFGKSERRDSTTRREVPVDDEHYELKVMNLPLVAQTRMTRISKKLEDSRDKTEFWMPAFPWRAIDYLNYKGSDVEGLYRVPGSGPQIKKWQRRFDEELDIDLFEQEDLYDINIIGSMLKAWMRELPDELFPKSSQDKIARECAGAQEVPQLLIDELSNLSPFNYYLLFAITCHLSLLLAHSDKNKMDFRNLCICFQPCMKIDAFCFNFLVNHWRDCWKGCKTEAVYTEQEYQLFEMDPPSTGEGRSSVAVETESHDERNVSSSDSSKPSSVSLDHQGSTSTPTRDTKPASHKSSGSKENTKKKLPLSQSLASVSSVQTVNTSLTVAMDTTPPRKSTDMRPLSPIKPLSPIGF